MVIFFKVSTYRLFVHLNTAIIIYAGLLWNALTLLRKPQDKFLTSENFASIRKIRRGALFILFCLAFNIMSGAFVAGIDAGKAFNTWPLMNDEYFIKKALFINILDGFLQNISVKNSLIGEISLKIKRMFNSTIDHLLI